MLLRLSSPSPSHLTSRLHSSLPHKTLPIPIQTHKSPSSKPSPLRIISMARRTSGGSSDRNKDQDPGDSSTLTEKLAIAAGLISTPVIAWSLFTLKTTGCGLPPGPGGSIGALEGVSYLAVVGIIGWSAYTKVKTGSGLPNGPFGLLGAVEGLSYLSLLAIIVVFGLQIVDTGSLPGPLPTDQCFWISLV